MHVGFSIPHTKSMTTLYKVTQVNKNTEIYGRHYVRCSDTTEHGLPSNKHYTYHCTIIKNHIIIACKYTHCIHIYIDQLMSLLLALTIVLATPFKVPYKYWIMKTINICKTFAK